MCFCAFVRAGNKIWEKDKNRAKTGKTSTRNGNSQRPELGKSKSQRRSSKLQDTKKVTLGRNFGRVVKFSPSSLKVVKNSPWKSTFEELSTQAPKNLRTQQLWPLDYIFKERQNWSLYFQNLHFGPWIIFTLNPKLLLTRSYYLP